MLHSVISVLFVQTFIYMYIFIHTKCSDKTKKNKRTKRYNVNVRAFKLDLHNLPQNNNVNESVLRAAHIHYRMMTQPERQEASR